MCARWSTRASQPSHMVHGPAATPAAAPAATPAPASVASMEDKPKPLCFAFNSEAGCAKGDDCRFLHEIGTVPTAEEREAAREAKRAKRKEERKAARASKSPASSASSASLVSPKRELTEEQRRILNERAIRFGLPTLDEKEAAEKAKIEEAAAARAAKIAEKQAKRAEILAKKDQDEELKRKRAERFNTDVSPSKKQKN